MPAKKKSEKKIGPKIKHSDVTALIKQIVELQVNSKQKNNPCEAVFSKLNRMYSNIKKQKVTAKKMNESEYNDFRLVYQEAKEKYQSMNEKLSATTSKKTTSKKKTAPKKKTASKKKTVPKKKATAKEKKSTAKEKKAKQDVANATREEKNAEKVLEKARLMLDKAKAKLDAIDTTTRKAVAYSSTSDSESVLSHYSQSPSNQEDYAPFYSSSDEEPQVDFGIYYSSDSEDLAESYNPQYYNIRTISSENHADAYQSDTSDEAHSDVYINSPIGATVNWFGQ